MNAKSLSISSIYSIKQYQCKSNRQIKSIVSIEFDTANDSEQ